MAKPEMQASGARGSRKHRLAACALLWLTAAVGCIYDPNARCGAHQHLNSAGVCVCDQGRVANATGECQPVVAKLDASIPDAAVPDASMPDAHAVTCNTTSAPCTDSVLSFCKLTTATDGYCKRPPTGQGQTCATQADCANFEASFCLVNPQSSTCLVPNCTDTSCGSGWQCSDLSAFLPGTPKVCIPAGSF